MTTLPDIPRLYTALAEVLAALLYAHRLPPRMDQRVIWGVEAGWAVLLGAFLQATGEVPLAWWIPCMAMAILSMLLFLWVTRSITLLEAGYVCARAFILAELAASVEWQLHCVLWPQRGGAEPLSLLLLAAAWCFFPGFFRRFPKWLTAAFLPRCFLWKNAAPARPGS